MPSRIVPPHTWQHKQRMHLFLLQITILVSQWNKQKVHHNMRLGWLCQKTFGNCTHRGCAHFLNCEIFHSGCNKNCKFDMRALPSECMCLKVGSNSICAGRHLHFPRALRLDVCLYSLAPLHRRTQNKYATLGSSVGPRDALAENSARTHPLVRGDILKGLLFLYACACERARVRVCLTWWCRLLPVFARKQCKHTSEILTKLNIACKSAGAPGQSEWNSHMCSQKCLPSEILSFPQDQESKEALQIWLLFRLNRATVE